MINNNREVALNMENNDFQAPKTDNDIWEGGINFVYMTTIEMENLKKTIKMEDLQESIILKIFSYLNQAALSTCLLVNRKWTKLAKDAGENLCPIIIFGKREWEKYLGEIGTEPSLPLDIDNILESPCPFWPGKKVKETHKLVLIPQTINGKRLTLKLLGKIVKRPKDGHCTEYNFMHRKISEKYGNQSPLSSHWVLMTKDVIPGSRNKSYPEQEALIADYAKQSKRDYKVSKLLDAVTLIFMIYIRSHERLFDKKFDLTYIRCQEQVEPYKGEAFGISDIKFSPQVVVGNFYLRGLNVDEDTFYPRSAAVGVAAVQKL